MCQGLPYWASGSPPLISPCNNYEIRCTSFEDPPLYNYWADYVDCHGVQRRQEVSIGNPWGPRSVHVCSSTVPVPGDNMPGPFPVPVSVTLLGSCGGDVPTIPCNSQQSYSGGKSFPSETIVTLGSSAGGSAFRCEAYNVPDKFMMYKHDGINAGQLIYDSGYRGDSALQNELNDALAEIGLPPESISGVGNITYFFTKTTDYTKVLVKVYAPMDDTAWQFSIDCPS